MERGEIVSSKPIGELTITIYPDGAETLTQFLKQAGCELAERGEHTYHLRLPAGTMEEALAGLSSPYTYISALAFPNGARLLKYVKAVLSNMTENTTTLAFPSSKAQQ